MLSAWSSLGVWTMVKVLAIASFRKSPTVVAMSTGVKWCHAVWSAIMLEYLRKTLRPASHASHLRKWEVSPLSALLHSKQSGWSPFHDGQCTLEDLAILVGVVRENCRSLAITTVALGSRTPASFMSAIGMMERLFCLGALPSVPCVAQALHLL